MLAAVISLLIQLCLLALVFYVVMWVLESIGIALPPRVIQIIWVICVLLVLYVVATQLLPALGGGHLLR